MERKITIVLGVIGVDCHVVGNTILNHFFTNAGFTVVNLGVMTSQEEFINAAIETDAHVIMVSSLYGHGEIDCRGLRQKCIESGIGDILLYVGGTLIVGPGNFDEVEKKFLEMGYDRVFSSNVSLDDALALLRKDLTEKGFEQLIPSY